MISIIIAAGYATRLYPLTQNFPKPLLQIGKSTILDRLMSDIDRIDEIDRHIIVTNHRFAPIFQDWQRKTHYAKPITILDDGTSTNETRLGAVRDILLAIEQQNIDDDILVLAADNILEFSLQGFVDYQKQVGTSVIMCHHEPELKKLQRTGVIEVDQDMKVLQMQEKPQDPVSHWAVPPFYIYRRADLPLIKESIANGCADDAPGSLARYLVEKSNPSEPSEDLRLKTEDLAQAPLHAWPMPAPRFDIGSLDSYKSAKLRFASEDSRLKTEDLRSHAQQRFLNS